MQWNHHESSVEPHLGLQAQKDDLSGQEKRGILSEFKNSHQANHKISDHLKHQIQSSKIGFSVYCHKLWIHTPSFSILSYLRSA